MANKQQVFSKFTVQKGDDENKGKSGGRRLLTVGSEAQAHTGPAYPAPASLLPLELQDSDPSGSQGRSSARRATLPGPECICGEETHEEEGTT